MPVTLRIALNDGTRRDIVLPAETWIRQRATAVFVDTHAAIADATLDPDHRLPDRNRSNNGARPAAGAL